MKCYGFRFGLGLALAIWAVSCSLGHSGTVWAQGAVVREAAEQIMRALATHFGKASTKEVAEQLAKYGAEKVAREVAERAIREGGEELVEKLASQVAKHGPDLLFAGSNAKSLSQVLRWIDELPADQVGPALNRLGAGTSGKMLCEFAEKYGVNAIKAEVLHRGVGTRLVQHLGDDGIRLAERLSTNEAIELARHAEDISRLPPDLRQGVLRLLYEDTRQMIAFMGRFVEKNPGKTLFTVGATTVLLANSKNILGGSDLVFDENGNPVVVSRPGIIERWLGRALQPWIRLALTLATVFGIGWITIKLYFLYRRNLVCYDGAGRTNSKS